MIRIATIIITLVLSALTPMAAVYHYGGWSLVTGDDSAVTIVWGTDTVINGSMAEWRSGKAAVAMAQCRQMPARVAEVDDSLCGRSLSVTLEAIAPDHTLASLTFLLPASGSYFVTSLNLTGYAAARGVDRMTPVNARRQVTMAGTDNRQLCVPYDNDAWVRFHVVPFGRSARESYEVGVLFDGDSRRGIVAGSIDHDTWKSAVRCYTSSAVAIDSLQLCAGVASDLTRDVRRHGTVRGAAVSSPRFIVAVVDDWRDGLEFYADLNARVSPNRTIGGPRPFGWNSWGDLQTRLNFNNASEVSKFFADELAGEFHSADSTVYIGLDSFWDFGFTPAQHREFVEACHRRGQKAGIYYCPFTDWSKNPDATVAEMPQYKMKDLYLTHDGTPLTFDGAIALDPTHPGTRARIARQMREFIDWGYEFVKIDFMAHGAYESDSHYDPTVMTGTQAYARGMEYIDSVVDGRMWINLSIAPLFPACYAQSRRIGCDAWSNIGSTEYTLNALTYGWWLDRLYHYNDADHIVFKGVSEGENRARLTSSAITGVYFLGDDFSSTGDPATLDRARTMTQVARINEMARRTKSFRPVRAGQEDKASDIFEYRTDDTLWVAMFNFDSTPRTMSVTLAELGLAPSQVLSVTELWTDTAVEPGETLTVELPQTDARILQIDLNINK